MMATLNEAGRITGGKINYHSERALEAVRFAASIQGGTFLAQRDVTGGDATGDMLSTLAYDHARGAARAALNRTRKVKR